MAWPALLVRDMGMPGYLAFALPNVIGAAAMGFVLSRPSMAGAIRHHHAGMVAMFSFVTVAFHSFAIAWLFVRWLGPSVAVTAGIATVASWIVLARVQRGAWVGPIVVWSVSLIVMVAVLAGWSGTWQGITFGLNQTRLGSMELAMLVPGCLFGFLLCPYLDGTFLRARQSTEPTTGRWAFGLGFGVVFALMIVLTLAYAGSLAQAFGKGDGVVVAPAWVAAMLVIHVGLQAGLTTALHGRIVAGKRGATSPLMWTAIAVGLILAIIAFLVAMGGPMAGPIQPEHTPITIGEGVYRSLLLFYGWVFPGYVLLCIVPTRGNVGMGRRQVVYTVVLILGLPTVFGEFVLGWTGLSTIGFTLLILCRIGIDLAAIRNPNTADRTPDPSPTPPQANTDNDQQEQVNQV